MDYPLPDLDAETPILIAGATASGKSDLAVKIAQLYGGKIINADAFQIYADWQILTARPAVEDMADIPHHLYGHVPWNRPYSVGDWLREITPLMISGPRPIIVGGTGLYFHALTQGLTDIPAIPDDITQAARAGLAAGQITEMLDNLDATTRARIDTLNPRRVQRAWEVQQATGRGLAAWQDETPPPLLPLSRSIALVLDVPKDDLTQRIETRFSKMVANGALDEVAKMAPRWDDSLQVFKAIGAPELYAHLRGELSLPAAIERASIATRQYAKRQRSWFRAKHKNWQWIRPTI